VSLPALIEIVPLDKAVSAIITVPGSKSITNRALILAALAEGETTLQGALWSEDTQVMVDCLQELGFMVNVAPDPAEFCNRAITVYGKGGAVPPGGTEAQPVELFVGNAGTAARFLTAFVCLGKGVYRLHGVPRMHERPQAALFQALRELGYRLDSPNDKLPAVVHGGGARKGECRVSIAESSQFASALILCSVKGRWSIKLSGQNLEELPYVQMTDKLLATFPHLGGVLQVEADASSGAYFLAAQQLLPPREYIELGRGAKLPLDRSVKVARWPQSGWQIDAQFGAVLQQNAAFQQGLQFAQNPEFKQGSTTFRDMFESPDISRRRDLGDSIMTAIVLAPFALEPVRFVDLAPLRLQECERVTALRTELTRCGAKVVEEDDTLTVYPSELHGAEIETYNDHRMAMCFAILGLKVPGIKLKNPACVKKTFPNFFQKLATPPPKGLGATIRDVATGRVLGVDELFAE
jgi:3-phosphoshikimate 1-carboxyvinyltransferase